MIVIACHSVLHKGVVVWVEFVRVPRLGDNLPALAQCTHLQSLRVEAVKNAIEAQREPTSQWRNIESSLPRYTKERFVPSQCSLSKAGLNQFGYSLSTCNAKKLLTSEN
jgi:hypothetical protein